MDKEKLISILESLIFVSREPLSLGQLCDLVPEAGRAEVKATLEELVGSCEQPWRGIKLKEVAGGWQFQTGSESSMWVGRLLKQRPVRLSRPALETLSIIAYRQPVTRPEVEEIRGVDSGGVIHTLLEYDFIKMEGRKDVPGRPIIYGTTKRFLEFFRLKSLTELPTLKELEELQEEVLGPEGALAEGEQAREDADDGPSPEDSETSVDESGDQEPGDPSEGPRE